MSNCWEKLESGETVAAAGSFFTLGLLFAWEDLALAGGALTEPGQRSEVTEERKCEKDTLPTTMQFYELLLQIACSEDSMLCVEPGRIPTSQLELS